MTTTTFPSLREQREEAGLTQIDLAVKADVGLETIRKAERGLRVRMATANALERALREHQTTAA